MESLLAHELLGCRGGRFSGQRNPHVHGKPGENDLFAALALYLVTLPRIAWPSPAVPKQFRVTPLARRALGDPGPDWERETAPHPAGAGRREGTNRGVGVGGRHI